MLMKPACLLALAAGFLGLKATGQDIAWGPATGITGDANLATGGTYVDAFIPNSARYGSAALVADGITFNTDLALSSNSEDDGYDISLIVTSGSVNNYSGGTFPSTAPSSAAFAAVMNAGGVYQNGGAGAGTVTLYGLNPGQNYSVQVFNYVSDGDAGLTTLSGSTPVTLGNLPGAGGPNTYGEFSTGTFTASGTEETFDWTGAGSGYTVLGAISLCSIPSNLPPTISEDTTPSSVVAYLNSITTFTAIFNGTAPITNQWYFSTDGGLTFNQVPDATNISLTLTNGQIVTNVEYYLRAVNAYGTNISTPASLTVVSIPPQTIAWGSASGITGDNSLVTNGVYVDAFVPNTGLGTSLTVDGITFNAATSSSSSGGSDGIITFKIISGSNNGYGFTTFPSAPPSSPDFAAVMNAGGTFEFGGSGSGLVIISELTVGHIYSVQVFNYANDADQGLTTLSGTTTVTLNNLPGAGGNNTYGEYATGTFTASSTNESFNWNGAGSGYTVLGAISVQDITSLALPILSEDTTPSAVTANQNTTTTFTAAFIGVQPITNQWQTSTDGGITFHNVSGAIANTLILTNSLLVTNVEYRLTAANANGTNYSTPATLTVVPAPPQTIFWEGAAIVTGDTNLVTSGVYFDAFIPNPRLSSSLTADGITFNAPNAPDSDGTISYVVTSGTDNAYGNNTLFTGGSADFNAIMNAGGTYEFGGAGSGIVTINNLTLGDIYSVQVFNYAGDNDTGLTTFSGTPSVTLSTEVGGVVTQGQFATGSFTATGTSESFTWHGDGSAYTVLGAISVQDVTGVVATNAISLMSSAANGTLQITWPPDHTGWTLQEQVNPTGVGLGANWVNVPGSASVNSFNIPVARTNGCVFLRLVSP